MRRMTINRRSHDILHQLRVKHPPTAKMIVCNKFLVHFIFAHKYEIKFWGNKFQDTNYVVFVFCTTMMVLTFINTRILQ